MSVETFLEMARKAGKGTGVVTTTRVTHATPAATYAHLCHRDLEFDIAAQVVPGGAGFNAALGEGLDVLLGGGLQYFDRASRPDARDLLGELARKGYTVVKQRSELTAFDAGSGHKLFGVFNASHLSYEADRVKQSPIVEPSLSEMTTRAIDVLSRHAKGYFLVVEGGRIDHALHESRARRALDEIVAFDQAIKAALARVDLADTLILVAADHDHTMIQNGYAHRVGKTTPDHAGILGLVRDPETNAVTLDADHHGYTILGFTTGQNRVSGKRTGVGSPDLAALPGAQAPLDEALTAGLDYRQEATFRMAIGAETHSGADVSIWAAGATSEQVHGFLTNTEVFGLLRCGAGL
jgi:alkaline phosphatase